MRDSCSWLLNISPIFTVSPNPSIRLQKLAAVNFQIFPTHKYFLEVMPTMGRKPLALLWRGQTLNPYPKASNSIPVPTPRVTDLSSEEADGHENSTDSGLDM